MRSLLGFWRFMVSAISAIRINPSGSRWTPRSMRSRQYANFSKFARFAVRSGCLRKNGMIVSRRSTRERTHVTMQWLLVVVVPAIHDHHAHTEEVHELV
jgi:hypothetical protein